MGGQYMGCYSSKINAYLSNHVMTLSSMTLSICFQYCYGFNYDLAVLSAGYILFVLKFLNNLATVNYYQVRL